MQSDLVDLTVQVVAMSDKAIGIRNENADTSSGMVDLSGNQDLIWLPKSQIEYTQPDKKGICEVTMPEWLAHQKGLI